MSLRHLHKDLANLGVYKDISNNGSGELPMIDVIVTGKLNKYHGLIFYSFHGDHMIKFNDKIIASCHGTGWFTTIVTVNGKRYTVEITSEFISVRDHNKTINIPYSTYRWDLSLLIIEKYKEIHDIDDLARIIKRTML